METLNFKSEIPTSKICCFEIQPCLQSRTNPEMEGVYFDIEKNSNCLYVDEKFNLNNLYELFDQVELEEFGINTDTSSPSPSYNYDDYLMRFFELSYDPKEPYDYHKLALVMKYIDILTDLEVVGYSLFERIIDEEPVSIARNHTLKKYVTIDHTALLPPLIKEMIKKDYYISEVKIKFTIKENKA